MRHVVDVPASVWESGSGRDNVRQSLHVLDACLEAVEDARERDELVVSNELAARLGGLVPGLRPRMSIAHAHELVLAQQERVLLRLRPDHLGDALQGDVVAVGAPLDETGARSLTERIRTARAHVCLLLLEANEGRAWSALGYPSWARYVRDEFGLSRSRAYELLEQARVIQTIRRALHLSGIPDVSPYAAAQVKPLLAEVLSAVDRRRAGLPEERVLALVKSTVDEVRGRGRRPDGAERDPGGDGRIDLDRLQRSITYLARLPPVDHVVARMPDDAIDVLDDARRAGRWLIDLADRYRWRDGRRGSRE
jgi:hypothetical protein